MHAHAIWIGTELAPTRQSFDPWEGSSCPTLKSRIRQSVRVIKCNIPIYHIQPFTGTQRTLSIAQVHWPGVVMVLLCHSNQCGCFYFLTSARGVCVLREYGHSSCPASERPIVATQCPSGVRTGDGQEQSRQASRAAPCHKQGGWCPEPQGWATTLHAPTLQGPA